MLKSTLYFRFNMTLAGRRASYHHQRRPFSFFSFGYDGPYPISIGSGVPFHAGSIQYMYRFEPAYRFGIIHHLTLPFHYD